MRFLIKRLESAEIVHSAGRDSDQVFFGASVKIKSKGQTLAIRIVGIDEVDPAHGLVSWISPVAQAMIKGKARAGDQVRLRTPAGEETIEVIEVSYP